MQRLRMPIRKSRGQGSGSGIENGCIVEPIHPMRVVAVTPDPDPVLRNRAASARMNITFGHHGDRLCSTIPATDSRLCTACLLTLAGGVTHSALAAAGSSVGYWFVIAAFFIESARSFRVAADSQVARDAHRIAQGISSTRGLEQPRRLRRDCHELNACRPFVTARH